MASFESRGPVRLSAQRSPARPTSAARFCACSERTRASSPDGVSSSRSSTLISPAWTVPVTTTPAPVRTKQRSTARRAKPVAPLPLSPSASSLVLSSSTPCPVSAETGTISAPLSEVEASSVSTSAMRSRIWSSSARSALVSATMPRSRPSRSTICRCSTVCGLMPSAADTTSRAASMPVAPASMLCTKRSWPGTSTKPSCRPSPRSL